MTITGEYDLQIIGLALEALEDNRRDQEHKTGATSAEVIKRNLRIKWLKAQAEMEMIDEMFKTPR